MANEYKNQVRNIRDQVKSTWDELKDVIEKHDSEVKKFGHPSLETKYQLERLNGQLDELEVALNRPYKPAASKGSAGPTEAKELFLKYVRYGKEALEPHEYKALVEGGNAGTVSADGAGSTGIILVPEELEAEIMRELPKLTVMRNLVSNKVITSNRNRIRSVNEVTVGWNKLEVGLNGTINTSSLTPNEDFQYVEDLYGLTKVGEDELQDSDVNLEALIADSFARALAYAEDTAFVVGTGHANNQPAGILNGSTVSRVTAKQAGAVTADDFLSLIYAVPPQYRIASSFLVNSRTELALRMLKDGKGQYLWQPSVQAGRPNTFLGYPIYNQEDIYNIPSVGSTADVAIFGDLKAGYRIVDHTGMQLTRLNELYAEQALVGFRIHRRVGGSILRPDALRALTVPSS